MDDSWNRCSSHQRERSKSNDLFRRDRRDRFRRDRRDQSDSSERSGHGKSDRYAKTDKYRSRQDRVDPYLTTAKASNDCRFTAGEGLNAPIIISDSDDEDGPEFKFDSLKRQTTTKECMSSLSAESEKDLAKLSNNPATSTKLIHSKHTIRDDIINKVIRTFNVKSNVAPLTPKGAAASKMIEEDGKRLANKYNPKVHTDQPDVRHSNKLQMVRATDLRLSGVRDPRVQPHQDYMRMQVLSSSQPPPVFISKADKYNSKVHTDQHSSDKVTQMYNQTDVTHSNNLQMVHANDPRLSRARVQENQNYMPMQVFSAPRPPPAFIPKYPPIIQSAMKYNMNPYPRQGLLRTPRIPNQHQNRFATHARQQLHPYPYAPQYPIPRHPNSRLITPHVPNDRNQQRNVNVHHQKSLVNWTNVSPPVHQYPYPHTYPEHNRNQPPPVHNKFRSARNLANVKRQKYEQSRAMNRRNSVYVEKNDIPRTNGESRRSLQAISSTSEKLNNETVTNTSFIDISNSRLDNAYRSGNFEMAPYLSVTSSKSDPGLKYRIPKKKPNEAAKSNEIHTTVNSKESDDEQASVRVRDSGGEVSLNARGVINSDSKALKSREKSAAEWKNVKDSPSTGKLNGVVTSPTSLLVDNQSSVTKEDMESMWKQLMMNPENLPALISLCAQLSDASTSKIKDITQPSNEMNRSPTIADNTEKPATSTAVKKNVTKTRRKKQKNDLESLNEDIRTTFLSDGVATATGRRKCAVYNNANKECVVNQKPPASVTAPKTKKKPAKRAKATKPIDEAKESPVKRVARSRSRSYLTLPFYSEE